jgi:hypothetical protein
MWHNMPRHASSSVEFNNRENRDENRLWKRDCAAEKGYNNT